MLDSRTRDRHTAAAAGLLLCALAALLPACIADESILHAASDQRLLAELDDAERSRVCASVQRKAARGVDDRDAKHAACLLLGAVSGAFHADALGAECQRVYDVCIRDGFEAAGAEPAEPSGECVPEASESCDVTVAEWEACVLGTSDELIDALSDATCADITPSPDGSMMPWQPSACEPVRERCPELFSPPMPEPDCALALETTGAVEAQLDWETDLCGWLGDGLGGDAILIDAPEGEPFKSIALDYEPLEPGTRDEAAAMGATLWTADGSAAWGTGPRGCTAELEAAACENWNGEPGVRYTFTNGTCHTPATAAIGRPAGTVEVRAFSGQSACLIR